MFDFDGGSFFGSDEVRLGMPYVSCLVDREYVAGLSNLIDSLKNDSDLSEQGDVYTVSDQHYIFCPSSRTSIAGDATATSSDECNNALFGLCELA